MTDGGTHLWLGVDTGGTFTDFVLLAGGRLRIHKVLSTPARPEEAILRGIRELGLEGGALRLVHGSTVGTNAVLEGKGARTALVTNRGLGDLLTLGRQNRDRLYDLEPPPVAPPVPEAMCLETGGRIDPRGRVVEPLTGDDVAAVADALHRLAPEAVAINLLFSFVDETFERRLAEAVPEGIFVSRSSAVLPEYREYERGITTWLNAYVGPRMEGYLGRLQRRLPESRVMVMQSSGERIDAERAGRAAVRLLLSGPAGGLRGGGFVGDAAGEARLLSFDMGGTSTDVAVIDGEPRLTTEGTICRYPVGVPMVDMHTIGAGGGSIARLDAGGALQVGPRSAGADPGPVCYGRGGEEPTVTDAHAVLGRLPAAVRLGGALALESTAARRALGRLGAPAGMDAEWAAEGVIRVTNEHMARALRVITVERGLDPRDFTLCCFGGAGGLHVCELADELGIRRALAPVHAGVLSALGMLAAPRGRQLSRTLARPLAEIDGEEVEQALDALARTGTGELEAEGVAPEEIERHPGVELRYRGQAYTLEVAWRGKPASEAAFHDLHEQRYGHRLDEPVELVNVRLGLRGPSPPLALPPLPEGDGRPDGEAPVHGVGCPVPFWRRERMRAGQETVGPAMVLDAVSTTWLAPGWGARRDRYGNLLLERTG